MGKIKGIVSAASGMIGDVPIATLARNSGVSFEALSDVARKLDGRTMSDIRKLPLDDPLRESAEKLLKSEMAHSFATRAITVKGAVKKVGKACAGNPALCAGAGISGYLAIDSYKKLKKEEKECYNLCIPDDWDKFKNGDKTEPTYKLKNAVSPYDPTIKYEELYPDHEDMLCTKSNMMTDGINPSEKDSCDKFCQNVCGFELTEVLSKSAETVGGTAADVVTAGAGAAADGLLPDIGKYAWIIGGGLVLLIILLIIIKKMM